MSAAIDFFHAIRGGNFEKVRSLLAEAPELLLARNDGGAGPFIAAKYSRQEAIASWLLGQLSQRGFELDIFGACVAGDSARVASLLAADSTLAAGFSQDGWTPLHLAAFFGQPRIAAMLLEAGASVDAQSRNPLQNQPIHAAAASRKADVVAILLERGADVNARQHGGWTALHAASQNGDGNLVRLLVTHGADRSARADNNQTAMDLALTGAHQDVVDILDEYETARRGVS